MALRVRVKGGGGILRAISEISRKLRKANYVEVGYYEKSRYPERGTPMPLIAAIQNFGAPKAAIPPRPFFSKAIWDNKAQWADILAAYLKLTKYDARKSLNNLGFVIKGNIQDSIRNTVDPPLAELTLMIRKVVGPNKVPRYKDVIEARMRLMRGERPTGVSQKPLVWIGMLLNTVDVKVK